MKSSVAAVLILWLGGSAAWAQEAATPEKQGEELVARHCSMCHAIGRTGMSPHAEAVPFRYLSRKYPVASLQEALGEGLVAGHPEMPEAKFTPDQVGAIIAYLESIQEH